MADADPTAVERSGTATVTVTKPARPAPRRLPPYHVVLHDDDDHTYENVIELLGKLFRHGRVRAFLMAREVDTAGRVIVDTTTKERAELKRDQIHAYGADWRLERSRGSMSATIEPAPDGG